MFLAFFVAVQLEGPLNQKKTAIGRQLGSESLAAPGPTWPLEWLCLPPLTTAASSTV